MIEELTGWVKSIVLFYIVTNFITYLLPKEQYVKYVKLFVGILFLIMVIRPIGTLTGSAQVFQEFYEKAVKEQQASDLKYEIRQAERTAYDTVTEGFVKEIQGNLAKLALMQRLQVVDSRVVIETDETSPAFGTIDTITMTVAEIDALGMAEQTGSAEIGVEPVSKVQIGSFGTQDKQMQRRLDKLKEKVAEFYEMEQRKVIIKTDEIEYS